MYKQRFFDSKGCFTETVLTQNFKVLCGSIVLALSSVIIDCRWHNSLHVHSGKGRFAQVFTEPGNGVASSFTNISRVAPTTLELVHQVGMKIEGNFVLEGEQCAQTR